MNTKQTILMALFAGLTLGVAGPAAAAPQSISFTGNLSDEAGPVAGSVNITARVFDGNNQKLWEERHDGVQPKDGLVFLELGSVDRENNALDTTVFDGGARFLEIEVDGDVLSPRLALLSVPYATHASYAEKTGEATFAKDAEYAENAGALGGKSASDFADASHNHDNDYAAKTHTHSNLLPKGGVLACTGSNKVVGLNGTTGNVICAADLNSSSSYSAGSGLSLNGSNQFSIASGGVSSTHIATGAVTNSDLANNAVTGAKIQNGAVTGSDLADSTVTGSKIANSTVTGGKIANATITGSKIANNTLTSTQIGSSAVGNSELASNAVTRSKISGTEDRVYVQAAGCGGGLTTSSSCKTRFAGLTPVGSPHFLTCSGGINLTQLIPADCGSLSTAGWLLAP